jgi:UDP-N-acetylglucosamine/UDP-N-acetylgalactosamine diphosphorylase
MNRDEAYIKLKEMHQLHILESKKEASHELLKQIEDISAETFHKMQQLIRVRPQVPLNEIKSLSSYTKIEDIDSKKEGENLLSLGKVGCLVVAGGQGTRLKFNGPKGMYPLDINGKTTLFEILAEKVLEASKKAHQPLPLAIMTSPYNHTQTMSYFEENHFFGLEKEQVSFFCQKMLPFLEENRDLFLESANEIARAPDGNGLALKHFVESGIYKKWEEKGILYVNFILIDNALADPFDTTLLGFHAESQADVVIKSIMSLDASEKVGILVEKKGKIEAVEYTEIPNCKKLKSHVPANISLFSFTMDFIKKAEKFNLPLHVNYKPAKKNDHESMAFKFEYYIFDVLPFAKTVKVLLYPREMCFCPLKNAEGENSPETVERALNFCALKLN